MTTIKGLTTVLLMTFFLASCKDKIVCAQIESSKIKPLVLKDISFQFDRCRIRCFDINTYNVLSMDKCPDTYEYFLTREELSQFSAQEFKDFKKYLKTLTSSDLPITACEGLSGFDIKDWAVQIKPAIIKLDNVKKDNCK